MELRTFPQKSSARARVWRCVLGLLIMGVAFAVTCVALHDLLPFPEVNDVRAKWAYFHEHPNDYDTLFVGSSRINHQIIPSIFDRLTTEGGQPTKTFNAGVAGMRPPEDSFLFEQLLAAHPQRLRWVFIELNNVPNRVDEALHGSLRGQYWHDWPRLMIMWDRLDPLAKFAQKRGKRAWTDAGENLAEFYMHLELFVREMTNLGKGEFLSRHLVALPGDWRANFPHYLGADLSGWRAADRDQVMSDADRIAYEKEQAEYERKAPVHDDSDPVSQDVLERIITRVEKLGATPVLLIAPRAGKRVFYPTPERAKRTLVLDFNDRKKYPVLFENQYRLDRDHLNTAGAEIFTRLLAEQWLAVLKTQPPTK